MKSTGYVKHWRSLWGNDLFQKSDGSYRSDYIAAWQWMIAEAQFKTNGIGRGQLKCSDRLLAKLFFDSSYKKARVFRAHLEARSMVIWGAQMGAQLVTITICNYDKFQGEDNLEEPQRGAHNTKNRRTNGRLLEEGKNDKKEENTSVPDDVRAAFAKFIAFADHTGLPKPGKLSAKRKQKIKARLNEHGLENWIVALRRAAKSDFIRSARWFTIDWLAANETNITKVLEGNYDNKQKPQEQTADEKFIERVRREHEGQPLPMPANGGSLLQ